MLIPDTQKSQSDIKQEVLMWPGGGGGQFCTNNWSFPCRVTYKAGPEVPVVIPGHASSWTVHIWRSVCRQDVTLWPHNSPHLTGSRSWGAASAAASRDIRRFSEPGPVLMKVLLKRRFWSWAGGIYHQFPDVKKRNIHSGNAPRNDGYNVTKYMRNYYCNRDSFYWPLMGLYATETDILYIHRMEWERHLQVT